MKKEEITIMESGDLKKTWIKKLNKCVIKNEKVRDNMSSSGKIYLVVNHTNNIDKMYKTKSVKNYVSKQHNHRYYSDASRRMVNKGNQLTIIKIEEEEILGLDNPQLFYNWIFESYRNCRGGYLNESLLLEKANEYNARDNKHIDELLTDEKLEEMKAGTFSCVDQYHNYN